MSHKRLLIVAAILAGVILASFALSVPRARDIAPLAGGENSSVETPSVALHDSFRKGIHTITGSVKAPNACTTASASAALVGDASNPTGILIEISLPEDTGVCLKRSTAMKFSTAITAAASLPLTATVNGAAATVSSL